MNRNRFVNHILMSHGGMTAVRKMILVSSATVLSGAFFVFQKLLPCSRRLSTEY